MSAGAVLRGCTSRNKYPDCNLKLPTGALNGQSLIELAQGKS